MMKYYLHENKWEDVEAYLKEKKTILLPVGSVEQHGKHLPLGTDSLLAQDIAMDVAEKTGVLIASPLWYGWAPHHMAYPGTVTLRPETLTQVVEDVLNSLIYHGFEKILIINGHREANLPPLRIALTRVRNNTGAFVGIADPFYINAVAGRELSEVEPGGIGHAEELETSVMYDRHAELCSPEAAVKNIPSDHNRFLQHDPNVLTDKILTASDVAHYKEATHGVGVMGDATPADKDKGREYQKRMVDNISEFVEYLEGLEVEIRKREIPL
ncbi:creatinine amidohydrolase [Salinicoccus kekensis]|uniref:Creatinine amidohydrolase n=2 Tax=Salinicoccus kekensis TaxID=714307 RepID=A0A285UPC6_9STAP|nr:creatinine amidohydrolase [Salinicoccus kekensis]